MWPREDEREEEHRALTELYDVTWEETSFVPAPDNPPARLVMWKDEPHLSDEEIEAIIEEVATEKRRAGGVTTTTFTKRSQLWSAITKQAEDEAVDEALERGVQVTPELIAAMRGKIIAADASLQEALGQLPGDYEEPAVVEAPVGKGRDEYAELAKVAQEMFPLDSPSVAIRKTCDIRPDLRDRLYAAQRS
jgi:hypothetical protein